MQCYPFPFLGNPQFCLLFSIGLLLLLLIIIIIVVVVVVVVVVIIIIIIIIFIKSERRTCTTSQLPLLRTMFSSAHVFCFLVFD